MKRLLLFTLICMFPLELPAQGSASSASYLKFMSHARTAALGDATVADRHRFSSTTVNPASLAGRDALEIIFSHTNWIQDVQVEQLSARVATPLGSVGIGLTTASIGGIEIREIPGPAQGTFTARSATLQLGFASDLSSDVTIGGVARYLYEKIYLDETTGISLDLGGNYVTPFKGLTAGISLRNLGKLKSYRSVATDLPSEARIGARYEIRFDELRAEVHGSSAHPIKAGISRLHVGTEIAYQETFTVRFGYQTGYDVRGLSAGFGIAYNIAQFDYAYIPFSSGLGTAHIFSLAIQF
jgi:hypothetical protein